MRVLEFFSKISVAPGIEPTFDTYLPPDTDKYLSISGFIQQDVFKNKNDTESSGLLLASSIIASKKNNNNTGNEVGTFDIPELEPSIYYITSKFVLYIKNEDGTFSSLPFDNSYVNTLAEPKSGSYLTVSNRGNGIFLNKLINITIEYNNNIDDNSWSKIILSYDDCENNVKNIISAIGTIIEQTNKLLNKHRIV